jgi:CRISPR-associated protein Cmr2
MPIGYGRRWLATAPTACSEKKSGKCSTAKSRIDGAEFFKPNAGIVYPAVHELAERSLAAAKSLRPFAPLPQHGHRCTLCGEREWLTEKAAQLHIPAGERRETPWLRKAEAGRFGIRKGEHLCGVCTLKRLWPTLFVEGLGELLAMTSRRVS